MANYDLKYDRSERKKEYLAFIAKKGLRCKYEGYNVASLHQCLTCERTWDTKPSMVKRRDSGCRSCSHTGAASTRSVHAQERYARICKKKKVALAEPYKAMLIASLHRCLKCGTEWSVKPADVYSAKAQYNRCPTCKKDAVSKRKLRPKAQLKKDIEKGGKKKVLKIERKRVDGKTKHRITYECLGCGVVYRHTKGVSSANHCADCGVRKSNSSIGKSKVVTLGGKTFKVRGFEDLALEYLTKIKGVDIERIAAGASKGIPTIKYTKREGTEHKYYPDMYLKDMNRLVEVKSTFTLIKYESAYYMTRSKALACIEQGYDFKLLMPKMEKKRTCVECYRIPKNWTSLSWREFTKEFNRLNDR